MNENSNHQNPDSPELNNDELDHVMRARRDKLSHIRELGFEPYPHIFTRSHVISDVIADFSKLADSSDIISIAGRIVSLRLMGKAAFIHLQDESGRFQVYLKKDNLGNELWSLFLLLDIGDIIGTNGSLFITKTGEHTLSARSFTLLSKSLRPLPAIKEKGEQTWYRWEDKEERYRQRPVDLILNADSRSIFLQRSYIVRKLREFFDGKDFIEVETPVLQPIYGGATARPFVTHHNSLDRDLFLRIADELYLKRIIVGGIPRVYEIAKDFRNEGIDRMHSPEFTMLEAYIAYEDYHFAAKLTEDLLSQLANDICGRNSIQWQNNDINITPPFKRITMVDAIRDRTGIDILTCTRNELVNKAINIGIKIEPNWNTGKLIDEIFSEKVQPDLIQPTFIIDYPLVLSPLAKRHRDNPDLVERFELYIGGLEIVNAFSELNDPLDQRQRFEAQARLRAEGDDEMPPIDEDFITSLEIGMPPTAGLGMGVDRLVMILTGASSIRDVILFPVLRPRN